MYMMIDYTHVFNFNLSSNKCDDMIVAREASVTIPGYRYVELCKGDKSDQKATEKLQSIRPVVQCKSNPNRDAISKKQVSKRKKRATHASSHAGTSTHPSQYAGLGGIS